MYYIHGRHNRISGCCHDADYRQKYDIAERRRARELQGSDGIYGRA